MKFKTGKYYYLVLLFTLINFLICTLLIKTALGSYLQNQKNYKGMNLLPTTNLENVLERYELYEGKAVELANLRLYMSKHYSRHHHRKHYRRHDGHHYRRHRGHHYRRYYRRHYKPYYRPYYRHHYRPRDRDDYEYRDEYYEDPC